MIWILATVLLAFWVLALAFKVTTGLIHVALVAALILYVLGFVRGRTRASAP
jgi:Family of unknown function (DUF5670)